MRVGDEFRLQTTEGAEWDGEFRARRASLRQSEVEIGSRRNQLFGGAVQEILNGIRLIHGKPKLRRTLVLHAGSDSPTRGGDKVTVWMRDGWSSRLQDSENDARRMGAEDPILHVHLPKKSADQLKDRIIDVAAARQVLDHYGTPTSPEGDEARESMQSRQRLAEQERGDIIGDIIRSAKVLQGVATRSSVRTSGRSCPPAPRRPWRDSFIGSVRQITGLGRPPCAVHGTVRTSPSRWLVGDDSTDAHPVAKEVLNVIGTGARGTAIHKSSKEHRMAGPRTPSTRS